jgi:hypothetical protein
VLLDRLAAATFSLQTFGTSTLRSEPALDFEAAIRDNDPKNV